MEGFKFITKNKINDLKFRKKSEKAYTAYKRYAGELVEPIEPQNPTLDLEKRLKKHLWQFLEIFQK